MCLVRDLFISIRDMEVSMCWWQWQDIVGTEILGCKTRSNRYLSGYLFYSGGTQTDFAADRLINFGDVLPLTSRDL